MKILEKIQFKKLISESAGSIPENSKRAEERKNGRKAGFTMIELIVVVAVLALLVSFTVGSLASVARRKATRAGKIIDSELSQLASNAYSREGVWRLEFAYDSSEGCYVMTQQYNTGNVDNADDWVDFTEIKLPSSIDVSFGGDEYDEQNSGGTHFVSLSREKGHYITDEGYFCDNIFVHSASKIVTIHMSAESGGHRVID